MRICPRAPRHSLILTAAFNAVEFRGLLENYFLLGDLEGRIAALIDH